MGNLNYKNDLKDAFKVVRMMSNPILAKDVDIDNGVGRRRIRKLSVDLAGKIRDSMFSSMKKVLEKNYEDFFIDRETILKLVVPELDRLEDKLFKMLYEHVDFKASEDFSEEEIEEIAD